MAQLDLTVFRGTPRATLPRLAALLPGALLLFVAAAFVLPSEPSYALIFYAFVVPCVLARSLSGDRTIRDGGYALAVVLIYWSAATLLWGRDDGGRWLRFAIDSAMTAVFVDAMMWVFRAPSSRERLTEILICAGAANAVLSIALGQILPQDGPRLHGWGATSHPILGASVMLVAYLAALCRGLAERRWRAAHLAAASVMALFVLLTESRGPLLAGLAATLFLCAAGPWRARALGTLGALAVLWLLLPASVRHHQASVLVSRGASHRFEIWHRTLQMIGDHPLIGNGLAANLDLPQMTFPHDLYLSVLFYSGIVGFVLFAALLVTVSIRLWRDRHAAGLEWLWLVSLWISTLLSGLTDLGQITKGPGALWFIFWLPVGLVLSRPRLSAGPSRRSGWDRAQGTRPAEPNPREAARRLRP